MMRKAGLLGSLALLLLASACAEEEKTGIETARSQMKPLVGAACDWMFGCCSPDELVYQVGNFTVDADDCSDRLLDAITAGVPLDLVQAGLSDDPAAGLLTLALAINEGRVDVNTTAVNKCADATSDRACNAPLVSGGPVGRCTPTATEVEVNPCDPNEMFRGKQAVGEECQGPWECKEGLRCADFGITGVCALRARENETCFSDAECADGLVCGFDEGTCQKGAKSGEACAYADPANPIPGTELVRCADGLTCDPVAFVCTGGFCSPGSSCIDVFSDSDCPESFYCVGNFDTAPTCQQPGLVGSPCSKPDDCSSNFCDPFNEVCADLLGNGDSCIQNSECASGFCTGSCQPSFEVGQPCASGYNEECRDGYCDSTMAMPVCTAYATENGACPNGTECNPEDDLFCVDAVCLRQPFPNGTPCVDSSQCASRACFMNECSAGAVIGVLLVHLAVAPADFDVLPGIAPVVAQRVFADVIGECGKARFDHGQPRPCAGIGETKFHERIRYIVDGHRGVPFLAFMRPQIDHPVHWLDILDPAAMNTPIAEIEVNRRARFQLELPKPVEPLRNLFGGGDGFPGTLAANG